MAWFVLMNRKTRTVSCRSRGRTRPPLLRGCHAPAGVDAPLAAAGEFLPLRVGHGAGALVAAALTAIGLSNPVADRLPRGFELASQILRITAGTDQLNHLAPEFRRVGSAGPGHVGHLSSKHQGVHKGGSNPVDGSNPFARSSQRHPRSRKKTAIFRNSSCCWGVPNLVRGGFSGSGLPLGCLLKCCFGPASKGRQVLPGIGL